MRKIKFKILYGLSLIAFLVGGIVFGYHRENRNPLFTANILDYAIRFNVDEMENYAITTSTKVADIEVVYEDYYLKCKESDSKSKMIYGTTMDKVKEDEKKEQEQKGLIYTIKGESNTKIIYTREVNEKCPNHFLVKISAGTITVYRVKDEEKLEVYTTLDNINIQNVRDEIKQKIKEGTYINSREELNRFIEDLES